MPSCGALPPLLMWGCRCNQGEAVDVLARMEKMEEEEEEEEKEEEEKEEEEEDGEA